MKSQNNSYKLDLTCLCVTAIWLFHILHFFALAAQGKRRLFSSFAGLFLCFPVSQSVTSGRLLMNQGVSTGSGVTLCNYPGRHLQEHLYLVTHVAGTSTVLLPKGAELEGINYQ